MELRDYQQEALETVMSKDRLTGMIVMATGLGKTVTFTSMIKEISGRALIMAHREELVHQPAKYIEEPVGFERAELKSNGERIVCASVMSLINRLDKFSSDHFDMIIVDEAHHASAETYQTIIKHFKPKYLIGFTATPNRADGKSLEIFEDIIFERNLEFGIKNGYLSPIKANRVSIKYDISRVGMSMGDFAIGELERCLNVKGANDAIRHLFYTVARGRTIIFCCGVKHAEDLAKHIGDDAKAIIGTTENRSDILRDFERGKLRCITTVQVLTEGVDIPNIETIIVARPTQSAGLYMQMVGRGTRLAEGKRNLNLFDCVGNAGRVNICTAPSLLGLSTEAIAPCFLEGLEGDLFDLPPLMELYMDKPQTWLHSINGVNLFAKRNNYNLHDISLCEHPDGSMICTLNHGRWIGISPVNSVGKCDVACQDRVLATNIPAQEAFDRIFKVLRSKFIKIRPLWSQSSINRWGKELATAESKHYCKGLLKKAGKEDFGLKDLSKREVACIIERLRYKIGRKPWQPRQSASEENNRSIQTVRGLWDSLSGKSASKDS